MTEIWVNYVPVVALVFVSILLVVILFLVSFFLGSSSFIDSEKLSTYECGFEPFSDTQGTFDVKFFLLAMLFMVFDLEIMFLLPWSVAFDEITITSLVIMLWFILVLTVAFVYEWLTGALEWQ